MISNVFIYFKIWPSLIFLFIVRNSLFVPQSINNKMLSLLNFCLKYTTEPLTDSIKNITYERSPLSYMLVKAYYTSSKNMSQYAQKTILKLSTLIFFVDYDLSINLIFQNIFQNIRCLKKANMWLNARTGTKITTVNILHWQLIIHTVDWTNSKISMKPT